MEQAQFTKTNCAGSLFTKADLTYVDFSHANLDNALIDKAELYRANLHEIRQENAIWEGSNKSAALPTDEKKAQAEKFVA